MGSMTIGPGCCGEWLPELAEKMGGVNELVGRVCPSWRMMPGLVALASSVVAIICAVVWKTQMLCIAFAPGAASSIYLTYLGWAFQDLKTFTQSNEELKGSIGVLQGENERLQGQLTTLQEEIVEIEKVREDLQGILSGLQNEKLDLQTANEQLSNSVKQLETFNETHERRAGAHVEQLQALQSSLSGIEQAAREDHTTFSENLLLFIKQVTLLQTTRSEFEQTGSSIETKMKEQVEGLLAAATMLQTIFTKIEEWKNPAEIERRIQAQQLLQKSTNELEKKVLELEKHLSRGEAQLEEQSKQLQDLQQIKTGFDSALNLLLTQVERLGTSNDELSKEVLQVAGFFKNYQLTKRDG